MEDGSFWQKLTRILQTCFSLYWCAEAVGKSADSGFGGGGRFFSVRILIGHPKKSSTKKNKLGSPATKARGRKKKKKNFFFFLSPLRILI